MTEPIAVPADDVLARNATAAQDLVAPDPAVQAADKISADAELSELAGRITQLPAGVKLSSNLDTYEKEKPQEPFWFQHGGAFFHLLDPDEVDFDDIIIVQENPRLMMHILLDPDQRGAYFDVIKGQPADEESGRPEVKGAPMKVGKMKKLVADYTRHYGLTDLGELGGSARR
jgi:hypothetical protein